MNANCVSPMEKHIRNSTLTKAKNLSTKKRDPDIKKSSSSIAKLANNIDAVESAVFKDHNQLHAMAPTLPIHSPLSPLLTDKTSLYHLKEAQLSARYINNTRFFHNPKKPTVSESTQSDAKSQTDRKPTSTTLSLKLLCYCEQNRLESEQPISEMSLDSSGSKRLVPTRNAATSPRLDVRKLGSMNTITPSLSLTNEVCMKTLNCKNNKFKIVDKNVKKSDNEKVNKEKSEKSISLIESKMLLSTRSLSPKQSIRKQHMMLMPDFNSVNIHFSGLPKISDQTNRKPISKLCRSEQSSPNIIDRSKLKFSYNKSTNRSTSLLGNACIDPWLKNMYSDNKSTSLIVLTKDGNELHSSNTETENSADPWIKRADVECTAKVPRNEFFRQTKSFSVSKFDVESIEKDSSSIIGTHSPIYSSATKSTSIINGSNQLQSAPTSPQFLTAENIFNSSTSSKINQTVEGFLDKVPARSSSFSPARANNSHKVFNLQFLNSPPPSISVATDHIQQQCKSNTNADSLNYDFLNVCNPNFLIARHSFSSVTDQKKGEELQLNIRRLSDQMRREAPVFNKNNKLLSSDRNVREKYKEENKVLESPNAGSSPNTCKEFHLKADFSEYLEQFRCSEAKKSAISKEKPCTLIEKSVAKTSTTQAIVINKTQHSSDCLLETTC